MQFESEQEYEKYRARKNNNQRDYVARKKQSEVLPDAPISSDAALSVIRRRLPWSNDANSASAIVRCGFETAERLGFVPDKRFWIVGPVVLRAENLVTYIDGLSDGDEIDIARFGIAFPFGFYSGVTETIPDGVERKLLQLKLDWYFCQSFDQAAPLETLRQLVADAEVTFPEGIGVPSEAADEAGRYFWRPDFERRAEQMSRRGLQMLWEYCASSQHPRFA